MRGLAVFTVLTVVVAAWIGCATQEEVASWDSAASSERSWHDRYVEDHCSRCPECCVELTAEGFVDEYGVERPLDWLPDPDVVEDDCAEAVKDLMEGFSEVEGD